MTKKELLEMPLHKMEQIYQGVNVIRVSGGWIYIFENTSCFVPEPIENEVMVCEQKCETINIEDVLLQSKISNVIALCGATDYSVIKFIESSFKCVSEEDDKENYCNEKTSARSQGGDFNDLADLEDVIIYHNQTHFLINDCGIRSLYLKQLK